MIGFVTPYVWMFITSFEKFRDILETKTFLTSLVQLEYNAFEPACVPVCTFTACRQRLDSYVADFIRLSDFRGHQAQGPKTLEAIRNSDCGWRFKASTRELRKIPGSPIAYWEHPRVRDCFVDYPPLKDVANARIGMATGSNERYVRQWYEVDFGRIGLEIGSRQEAMESGRKWFPYAKGGEFRKWYGNNREVVNWENDGHALQTTKHPSGKRIWAHNFNLDNIFKPSLSWTFVTSAQNSFRYHGPGFLFDSAAGLCQPKHESDMQLVAAVLNSNLGAKFLALLNPTLNLPPGYLERVPTNAASRRDVSELVDEAIRISKEDEECMEECWDFQRHPYLNSPSTALSDASALWESECSQRVDSLHEIEQKINTALVGAYQLDGIVSPEVAKKDITLYRSDSGEDVRRLISYAVGCMMGRYSLDQPGLQYAHGASGMVDPAIYSTFPADEDGIVPNTLRHWFPETTSRT